MTTEIKRPGAYKFVALEIALEVVGSLRDVVREVRRHDSGLAQQIVRSASSIAANIGEGNRRQGRDSCTFFASRLAVRMKLGFTFEWRSRGVGSVLKMSLHRWPCSTASWPCCGGSRTEPPRSDP
jgi:hypothetical protein